MSNTTIQDCITEINISHIAIRKLIAHLRNAQEKTTAEWVRGENIQRLRLFVFTLAEIRDAFKPGSLHEIGSEAENLLALLRPIIEEELHGILDNKQENTTDAQ